MKCPLINSKFVNIQGCISSDCAWWDTVDNRCAVLTIARHVQEDRQRVLYREKEALDKIKALGIDINNS